MRTSTPPRLVLLSIFAAAAPVSAQMIEAPLAALTIAKPAGLDIIENSPFASDRFLSGYIQVPVVHKASANLPEVPPVYISQDALTLNARRSTSRSVENVLDLSVLKETSAYREADRVKTSVSDSQATGIQKGLEELSAAYRQPAQTDPAGDCKTTTSSIGHRVKMDVSQVLQIVEAEVSANPNCACEIVKTAIKASEADAALVANIAETAITSAPDSMRMIAQCAIAALPEALPEVQAVLARLDPNGGDTSYSAKDSKSGKDSKAAVASIVPPLEPANPLDLPPMFPPRPPQSPLQVTNPNPRIR